MGLFTPGYAAAQDQDQQMSAADWIGTMNTLNQRMNAQRRQQMRDQADSNYGGQLPSTGRSQQMDNYAQDFIDAQGGRDE